MIIILTITIIITPALLLLLLLLILLLLLLLLLFSLLFRESCCQNAKSKGREKITDCNYQDYLILESGGKILYGLLHVLVGEPEIQKLEKVAGK